MAYAMTKCGSLDNCVTYEFICDTIADMNAIENQYRTIGTVAIVLTGESEGLEVYITGSNKQWNSLSAVGGSSSGLDGGLEIYICGQNDISNGLPDIAEPSSTTIYLVPSGNTTGNLYEEYIYVDDAWEKFGAASIDLSNYIQKTDIATQSTAGLVKVLDNGNVTFNENNQLVLTLAGTAVVKTGQSDHPISVTHQHEAAFYGLAKAAGQDMKNSDNAVGTYTTEAASAIRNMIGAGTYSRPNSGIPAADLEDTYLVAADISGLAPKASPEFTGSISLGRKANTTIGNNSYAQGMSVTASGGNSCAQGMSVTASGANSHAEGRGTTSSGIMSHAEGYETTASGDNAHSEGYDTTASGATSHVEGQDSVASGNISHAEGNQCQAIGGCSHAEGMQSQAQANFTHAEGGGTIASGYASHSEGLYTIAAGKYEHVSGAYNIADTAPAWVASTEYAVGDLVLYNNTIYKCKTANTDSSFTSSHWTISGQFLVVVGNGTGANTRANAYALDWEGNEYLNGTLYINCNNDSTGGSPVATEATVAALTARVATLEAQIASLMAALESLSVPVNAVTMENGEPMTDENGNYIEFDVPTT